MREGKAETQKQYTALVWTSHILKDEDFQCISLIKDMHILQRTPISVLHPRSPLEHEKIVHWMRVERIVGSSQYFLLHLCTRLEHISSNLFMGILDAPNPALDQFFCTRAEVLPLDVTDVNMDWFSLRMRYRSFVKARVKLKL